MTAKAAVQSTAVGLAVGAGLDLIVGLLVSGGPEIGLDLALGAGVGIAIGVSLESHVRTPSTSRTCRR
jgi:hypothetical protein